MKQNIIRSLMAVTFMATLLFSGCQKDSVTLRIRINDFGGNGKVYMDSYNPHWSSSEAFRINGEDYQVNGISGNNISLSVPSSPSYSAFYPSQFYSSSDGNSIHFTLPRVQYYKVDGSDNQLVKAPMAAFATTPSQTASNVPITFNNIGALLAINIDNNLLPNTATLTVDSVVVTTVGNTLPLWGDAVLPDITDTNSYYQCVNTPDHEKYYTVSVARGNGDPLFTLNNGVSRKVYIFIPSAEALSSNKFKITVHYNGGSVMPREQTSATGGLIRHGMMATVSFEMRNVAAPAGAVPGGQFSVWANRKVWFSAGNLQWKPNTNMGTSRSSTTGVDGKWRFATNQWDFVGYGGTYGNISESNNNRISDSTYAGWIDMFGWGTSGNQPSSDTSYRYYKPFDYVMASSAINTNNNYGYGPTITSGDLAYDYDWGNNTIYYGGLDNNNIVSTSTVHWRTLTYKEWGYVLGVNSNQYQRRIMPNGQTGLHFCFSPVIFRGFGGLLIYHDNYSEESLTNDSNPIYRFGSTEDIPAGCVFLPTTSLRSESTVNTGNTSEGYYWSSSYYSKAKAWYILFKVANDGFADPRNTERYKGLAVRLVTPVQ